MSGQFISIRGASEGPLRQVDLELPLGELICLLGQEGSGSRELAFQVLYTESRRRYAQVLSAFERETLGGGAQVEVEQVRGLPPALYLDGRPRQREKVAGSLNIEGLLGRLWLERGERRCPACGGQCLALTPEMAVEEAIAFFAGEPCLVLAPSELGDPVREELRRAGFLRVRLGGEVRRLDGEGLAEGPGEVVVDRVNADQAHRSRLTEACRQARTLARGLSLFAGVQSNREVWLNQQLSCRQCGTRFPELNAEDLVPGSQPPVQVVFKGWSTRELADKQVDQLLEFLAAVEGSQALCRTLAEAQALGLGHLPLGRPVDQLSTGEQQGLQLASCLSLGLTGILYLFDSPSRGLDSRGQEALAKGLLRLVAQGSTAVVLDHTPALVRAAGLLLECAEGRVTRVPVWQLPLPPERRTRPGPPTRWLRVQEAGGEWRLPLGRWVCLCGPTGGGKTALLRRVLLPGLHARRGGLVLVEGRPGIQRAAEIGRLEGSGEKSLLAYLGIFEGVAGLYAETAGAGQQGYGRAWFMLDRPGGRCPTCEGTGALRCDLEFLDDVSLDCPACEGRRFRPEALAFTWRGLTLSQVLELPVTRAAHHFRGVPQVGETLQAALDCGLGHRQLGEACGRLGTAEGLRLQLAGELKRAGARELLVLQHPEAGGHPRDLLQLLQILEDLRDRGTSVVVETHHPALIGAADWVVEVRPGQRVRSGPGPGA
ncbi:MAG: hypothetical protein HYW07_10070 [Candidatus Latescibacteria bacterium]|nr:hypothetical protein [Candidatus Latescibacterota bacterium]